MAEEAQRMQYRGQEVKVKVRSVESAVQSERRRGRRRKESKKRANSTTWLQRTANEKEREKIIMTEKETTAKY